MKVLAVKHFDDLQHYKDRSPPWIKLYNRLLDDYAFLSLSEVSQRHLMMIWLIASRHDNRIPYDLAYVTRAIHARGKVDYEALLASGFLMIVEDPASTGAAPAASTDPDPQDSGPLAETAHSASNGASGPLAECPPGASPRVRVRAQPRARERESRGETEENTGRSWPDRISGVLAQRGISAKPGKVGALLKPAVDRFSEARVVEALENFLDNGVKLYDQKPQFVTLEMFAKNPGPWVDQITPIAETNPDQARAMGILP